MKYPRSTTLVSSEELQALRQLFDDYADTLDEQDLQAWPEYFTEDCLYQVISREGYLAGLLHATMHCDGLGMVKDRAQATQECTVYEPRFLRHFMHGLKVVGRGPDSWETRCNFMVIESTSDDEPRVLLVGQYVDVVVDTPQGLKFRRRLCVYDNFRIYTSLVFPV